jgi:hypothetical protein
MNNPDLYSSFEHSKDSILIRLIPREETFFEAKFEINAQGSTSEIITSTVITVKAYSIPRCRMLFNRVFSYSQNSMYQEAYDTAKYYIETCPDHNNSHMAFSDMTAAVQFLSLDKLEFREWLRTVVLYPSKNPHYFCSAVFALAQTYKTNNQLLAVLKFMIEETECNHEYWRETYAEIRRAQYEEWLRTDTTINKLDTTLPSLEELGLELLRDRKGDVKSKSVASAVSSLIASPNPTNGFVTLSVDLETSAWMNVEIYDVLGKVVSTVAADMLREKGKHELNVDLRGFPAGTYFVRLSTLNGESKTAHVVKN